MRMHYIPASFCEDMAKLNAKELAEKYNKPLSTIYKWIKKAKTRPETIERNFQVDGYILGVLWAVGYDTGKEFFVRHRNLDVLEILQKHFRQESKNIILGTSNTNEQWKLKITGDARRSILVALSRHGWTTRNSDIRPYPVGDVDHKGFIRAWIEIHSSLDFRYGKARKPRLRIYGNQALIVEMNDVISRLTGVSRKTPQKLHNGKTYALYYVSRDVATVYEYFGLEMPEAPSSL